MNRYIVFMKQVPLSTKIDMDPETKTLKRSSALAQVNPDDLHALQCALDLKKLTGAEVVAVTMGPPSAEEVLREALQRGADRGILLTSRAFAGSDTYCTARVLASVAERIGDYSILFFGRMAIDGDTAQVGPEVAGMLGIPQCTYLVSIDKVENESVVLSKLHGNVVRQMEVQLPCAVMVGKENSRLDCLTLAGWRRAMKQDITVWNENDLQLDLSSVGLNASPTKVVSTEIPQNTKNISWLDSSADVVSVVEKMSNVLNCQTL